MRPQAQTPIHQCMQCKKRSLTLYCDNCAPPMTPRIEALEFHGDRRHNRMGTASDGHETPYMALSPVHRVRAAY